MEGQPPLYQNRLLDQNFGMCISPQDQILPSNNFFTSNYYRPWKLYIPNATSEFGSTIENEKKKFQITLDVQHFKPNEVSVKVVSNEVVIEGKHEERLDDHGMISRQFTRRYILPNDCNTEDVTSTLSSDGVLIVMSNKKAMEGALNERSVPIKLCESFSKTQQVESSQVTSNKSSIDSKIDSTKRDSKNKNKTQILKEEHSSLLRPELIMDSASNTCSKNKTTESKKETEEMFRMSGLANKVDQLASSMIASSDEIMKTSMTSSTDETIKTTIDKMSASMAAASLSEYERMSGTANKVSQLASGMISSSDDMMKTSMTSSSSDEFMKPKIDKITSSDKAIKSSVAAALSSEFGLSEKMGKSNIAASSEMTSFESKEMSQIEESTSSFTSSIKSSINATSETSSELFSDTISAALKKAADNM